MRKLLCKWFDHKWEYDPLYPCSWRRCKRCHLEQYPDYSGDIIRNGPEWKDRPRPNHFIAWLCEKAGTIYHHKPQFVKVDDKSEHEYPPTEVTLELLVYAMFGVNDDDTGWELRLMTDSIHTQRIDRNSFQPLEIKSFRFAKNKESKKKALVDALEHIYILSSRLDRRNK